MCINFEQLRESLESLRGMGYYFIYVFFNLMNFHIFATFKFMLSYVILNLPKNKEMVSL